MSAHQLKVDDISRGLDTLRIGRRVLVFEELGSTNTHALENLRELGRAADGTAIFAEHQTAGRGRLGRKWQSPRGASLLFTILLVEPRETGAPRTASRLTIVASVAAAEAIRAVTDVEAVIRWPNDLYVRDKKLAGILIETRDWSNGLIAAVIGIGINCLQQPGHFPPDLIRPATSLDIESSRPISRPAVARAILHRLDQRLADVDARLGSDVHEAWKQLSNDIGQRVTLVESGVEHTGRILDLDPADGLLLQLDGGARRAFHAHSTTRL